MGSVVPLANLDIAVPKNLWYKLFAHTKCLVQWYTGTVPARIKCSRPTRRCANDKKTYANAKAMPFPTSARNFRSIGIDTASVDRFF